MGWRYNSDKTDTTFYRYALIFLREGMGNEKQNQTKPKQQQQRRQQQTPVSW